MLIFIPERICLNLVNACDLRYFGISVIRLHFSWYCLIFSAIIFSDTLGIYATTVLSVVQLIQPSAFWLSIVVGLYVIL